MLLEKIESLRKQPKAVRNQYAFGTALGVTVMIALVWLVSLPARLTLPPTTETSPETADLLDDLQQIQAVVGEGLEDIQAQAELVGALATSSAVTATSTQSINIETNNDPIATPNTTSTSP